MTKTRNRHGLSRYIPLSVRREVRRRCKFGCVICRRGFYQYEHIEPLFDNAPSHDPDLICCLCGSCHDAVTRGQISKMMVAAAYRLIQEAPPHAISSPVGPLDFHTGTAELLIGGLLYSPAVRTVLRYHGRELIQVLPSAASGQPGAISATFTDEQGREVLRLRENEWIGSTSAWDIDVTGKRLTVRRSAGRVALQLRLDPPGRIVVEQLDMRINEFHILATDTIYAVGRYTAGDSLHWVHAHILVHRSSPHGVAIDLTTPLELERRDLVFRGSGAELATANRLVVLNANSGVLVKPLGIAIGTFTGSFHLIEVAVGRGSLEDVRAVIADRPEVLCRFITTGRHQA